MRTGRRIPRTDQGGSAVSPAPASARSPSHAHRSFTSRDEDSVTSAICLTRRSGRQHETEHHAAMNGRSFARVLLLVILIAGAIGLGVTAYDAGVTAGLAQNGNVVVNPGYAVAPYAGYGWGFGHGFGFFGFLGGLLFLFLLFGLIRAAFGGSRRGWGSGHGHGWSAGGWRDEGGRSWEDRAREAHDAWHRNHPDDPNRPNQPTAS